MYIVSCGLEKLLVKAECIMNSTIYIAAQAGKGPQSHQQ